MNKKILIVISGLLFMLLFSVGQAQSKVGFVNSQEILAGTAEGKAKLGELDEFWTAKQKDFDTRNQEINTLQQNIMAQQRTLDADSLAKMQRDLEQKQTELRRFQEDSRAEGNERQNSILQSISQKVQVIIEEYAKNNAFAVIFVIDQSQAYVSPKLDVTAEIIKLYDERYPLGS